jgi:hypothetical protein
VHGAVQVLCCVVLCVIVFGCAVLRGACMEGSEEPALFEGSLLHETAPSKRC